MNGRVVHKVHKWNLIQVAALSHTMIILKALAFASIATSALAQLQPLSNAYDVQARLRATSGDSGRVQNVTTLHLSALAVGDDFTTLNHPGFPAHQVRVKKTEFCDPTVK